MENTEREILFTYNNPMLCSQNPQLSSLYVKITQNAKARRRDGFKIITEMFLYWFD